MKISTITTFLLSIAFIANAAAYDDNPAAMRLKRKQKQQQQQAEQVNSISRRNDGDDIISLIHDEMTSPTNFPAITGESSQTVATAVEEKIVQRQAQEIDDHAFKYTIILLTEQYISSPSTKQYGHYFWHQQVNGNLKLYYGNPDYSSSYVLWESGYMVPSTTHIVKMSYLSVLQNDGNFVTKQKPYDSDHLDGETIWETGLPDGAPIITNYFVAIRNDMQLLSIFRGTPQHPGPIVYSTHTLVAVPTQLPTYHVPIPMPSPLPIIVHPTPLPTYGTDKPTSLPTCETTDHTDKPTPLPTCETDKPTPLPTCDTSTPLPTCETADDTCPFEEITIQSILIFCLDVLDLPLSPETIEALESLIVDEYNKLANVDCNGNLQMFDFTITSFTFLDSSNGEIILPSADQIIPVNNNRRHNQRHHRHHSRQRRQLRPVQGSGNGEGSCTYCVSRRFFCNDAVDANCGPNEIRSLQGEQSQQVRVDNISSPTDGIIETSFDNRSLQSRSTKCCNPVFDGSFLININVQLQELHARGQLLDVNSIDCVEEIESSQLLPSPPSLEPSIEPSSEPSEEPSSEPSEEPSSEPSEEPSADPSAGSEEPTAQQIFTIGGTVFLDNDGNGIQDFFDAGIEGVTLSLVQDSIFNVLAKAITDRLGKYLFDDDFITAGTYTVVVTDAGNRLEGLTFNRLGTVTVGSQRRSLQDGEANFPCTNLPSSSPTLSSSPTHHPTESPSDRPSSAPTNEPSISMMPSLSIMPTSHPTAEPSEEPSESPTEEPSEEPTEQPTASPSRTRPSATPTSSPTKSSEPSQSPTISTKPSKHPSSKPSKHPSVSSNVPSQNPSSNPSVSMDPSTVPSTVPTSNPSTVPTSNPSTVPTSNPSTIPTSNPSTVPTSNPSTVPTSKPSQSPSRQPTAKPTEPESSCISGIIHEGIFDQPNEEFICTNISSGLVGIEVCLFDDEEVEVECNTTDFNGTYQFCNLGEGNYTVNVSNTTEIDEALGCSVFCDPPEIVCPVDNNSTTNITVQNVDGINNFTNNNMGFACSDNCPQDVLYESEKDEPPTATTITNPSSSCLVNLEITCIESTSNIPCMDVLPSSKNEVIPPFNAIYTYNISNPLPNDDILLLSLISRINNNDDTTTTTTRDFRSEIGAKIVKAGEYVIVTDNDGAILIDYTLSPTYEISAAVVAQGGLSSVNNNFNDNDNINNNNDLRCSATDVLVLSKRRGGKQNN